MINDLLDNAIAILNEIIRLRAGVRDEATVDEVAAAFDAAVDMVFNLRADLAVALDDLAEGQHRAACGLEG